MIKHLAIVIAILAFTAVNNINASKPKYSVDLNRIKVDVLTNPDRYQALTNRFLIGDSTLSVDEMSVVYYGYAFTTDYDPTDRYDEIERAYSEHDYDRTWKLCFEALKYNPVSLDLTIKALVAANNGTDARARALIPTLQNRYDLISTVILSSGMGTTTESPFIVINDDDLGRIIRNVICVESTVGRATVRNLDAIKVKMPTSDRQHILYFDNNLQRDYERSHR